MKQGVRYYKRCEYEIAFLLTGKYSTNELCKETGINRSGFYKRKNRLLKIKVNNIYHEITFYMDLFNNEIVAYGLSYRRGDNKSYYDGLKELIEKKKEYKNLELVLHTRPWDPYILLSHTMTYLY